MNDDAVSQDRFEQREGDLAKVEDLYFKAQGEAQLGAEREGVEALTQGGHVHVGIPPPSSLGAGAEQEGEADVATAGEGSPQGRDHGRACDS
jgi:hypothetical protein